MSSTNIFNLGELIELRRSIHKYAEPSFKEHKTKAKIRSYLISKGVVEAQITEMAKTGLVVDIRGKGPPTSAESKVVALRADMDALVMKEQNYHLPYRSVTNAAHMCFHDGHVVSLLGAIAKLLENLEELPGNHTARFLFQPAEEKFGGAKLMVQEGCLLDVQEVWGLHFYPCNPPNTVHVKSGVANAGTRAYKITVLGKEGHSSLKSKLINPVSALCDFNVSFEKILRTKYSEENEKLFTICFPRASASPSNNVISRKARMEGVLRYLDHNAAVRIDEELRMLAVAIGKKYNTVVTVKLVSEFPVVTNADHLCEALKHICPATRDYPTERMGADDFSELSTVVPGCYFMFFVGAQNNQTLHCDSLDFNDDCLEPAAELLYNIVRSRLSMAPGKVQKKELVRRKSLIEQEEPPSMLMD